MSKFSRRLASLSRGTFAAAVVALVMLEFGASSASATEPIVGLWQITLKDSGGNFIDSVFSGWTSDGLEFDQDISRTSLVTGYGAEWASENRHGW
jgi:hypothetical protein